jgi:DNA-binding MarR family transcriptional regulator
MVEGSSKPAAGRWLDDEERLAWLAYVDAATLLDDYLNRQLRRDAGLTHGDYTLLAHLSAVPGHALSMSQLAERLRITRSLLTHTVGRLEQAGYVSRAGDPANGRARLALLTEHGLAKLEQAAPGHVAAVRRALFDVLTREQVRHLAEIGEAIVHALVRIHDDTAHDAAPWRRR